MTIQFVPPRTRACDDCPFWRNRTMHKSLGKSRMDEITENVADGGYFPCHKTTRGRRALEDDHGGWENVPSIDKLAVIQKEQVCFGARNFVRTGGMLEDGIDPEA